MIFVGISDFLPMVAERSVQLPTGSAMGMFASASARSPAKLQQKQLPLTSATCPPRVGEKPNPRVPVPDRS
jgi:hypothetical protein